MKLLVRKSNQEVVMYSEGEIGFDPSIFELKDYNLTENDKKEIHEDGGKPYFKNNKLEIVKNPHKVKIDNLKKELDEAGNDTDKIKNVIKKLLE